jgi:hypothetical protein
MDARSGIPIPVPPGTGKDGYGPMDGLRAEL